MTTSQPTGPAAPTAPPKNGLRARVWGAVLAVVVVIAMVAAGVALVRSRLGTDETAPEAGGSASATASTSPSPSPTASQSSTRSPSTTSPSGTAGPATFRFLPLWPFASVADAIAWQREALPGGHQPWRLDPGLTALSFAASYLGYTEMDRVTSRQVVGDEAWVGVAASLPEARTVPAAVLHLARIGAGPLAQRPWEVVGSRDRTLTLTTPKYGAAVGTTFRVGGRITGVDEWLVVQVRDRAGGLLARSGGIPAGGDATPWEVTMTVTSAGGPATVAVSTGGHIAQVEMFAITAVTIRSGGTAPVTYGTASAALAAATMNGSYVGACGTPGPTAGVADPVCSVSVRQGGGHYLYRLGFMNTDAGCFVILGRSVDGRWTIVDPWVDGADVPAELGGPILTP